MSDEDPEILTVNAENANNPVTEEVTFRPQFLERPRLGTRDYETQMMLEDVVDSDVEGLPPYNPLEDESGSRTAQSPPKTRQPPSDWYIPDQLPYTHTHIEELGGWPQRLLHVESMVSYEWTSGNVYGGHKEPAYCAVSYTWGRWQLPNDDGETGVESAAIKVHGVPWRIPRIDPVHFRPADLTQALQRACALGDPPVHFVWLDIACMDQRRGPAASREVGRQASIFLRASGVAVWLARTGGDDGSTARLVRRLALLERAAGLLRTARSGTTAHEGRAGTATQQDEQRHFRLRFDSVAQTEVLDGVREMLCDPWFTGIWTLQEAFLARKAFFLLAKQPLRVPLLSPAGGRSPPPMPAKCTLFLIR
ncbi:hypothetical protein PG997_008112 [Apiospora hydei]|uniref:Heterokaryon incompatibility domain-containing protein n=1 Tax=Apiospora hydei TaxID=1337664 RepID=A0ABR1W9W5_9PEZI